MNSDANQERRTKPVGLNESVQKIESCIKERNQTMSALEMVRMIFDHCGGNRRKFRLQDLMTLTVDRRDGLERSWNCWEIIFGDIQHSVVLHELCDLDSGLFDRELLDASMASL